jgi:hypothetical protein
MTIVITLPQLGVGGAVRIRQVATPGCRRVRLAVEITAVAAPATTAVLATIAPSFPAGSPPRYGRPLPACRKPGPDGTNFQVQDNATEAELTIEAILA